MDLDTLKSEVEESLLGDEFIERLRAEASVVGALTVDPLKGFCEIQKKHTPNVTFPTAGGKIAWDTLLEIQGWKVQRNKLTKHIRILDDRDFRRAWGNEWLLLELYSYLHHLRMVRQHSKQYHSKVTPDLGIVFCGGGAKGAYQIGVWKRLQELGLESRINGVSGASVGALNSLLFVQGDLDLAESIWLGIKQKDMTRLKQELPTILSSFTGGIVGGLGVLSPPLILASGIVPIPVGFIMEALLNGAFSRDFLEDIFERKISEEKVMNSNKQIYTCIASLSLPNLSRGQKRSQNILAQAEYRRWDGLTFPEIKDYVFASSALPLAYGTVKINGDKFIDGGVADNEPAYPLAKAGFSTIFVIHLNNSTDIRKRAKIRKRVESVAQDTKIIHIRPNESLAGTLEINPALTRERMDLGYADACAQLEGYV